MIARRAGLIAGAVLLLAAGACGGSSGGPPRLLGTAIPSVAIAPTATPVCAPPSVLPLPPNFPGDVQTPPDYQISELTTTPFLHVSGTTLPPLDPDRVLKPHAVVGETQGMALQLDGWTLSMNRNIPGIDYDFSKPDGRTGHFNSSPVAACPGYVRLTLDLRWVTPAGGAATAVATR